MTRDELLKMIKTSSPRQWRQITEGPTYRGFFVESGAYGEPAGVRYLEHPHTAVFEDDVDLTVAWGLDPTSAIDSGTLDFGFPNNFPDPDASEDLADFFYRGALIHRERLLSVDGNRALLPICMQRASRADKKKLEFFTTSESRDVARLVHSFTHPADFDEYLSRAGILIED